MKKPVYIIVWMFIVLASCTEDEELPRNTVANGTRLQLSLDSLYLYARETYLWYDVLPDYDVFNPRQYAGSGSDLSDLTHGLNAITALAINPETQQSYEYRPGHNNSLYSYIAEGNIITGRRGEVSIDGKGNDMGLGLAILNDNTVYISYVENGSPAAEAGLTRGMQVIHIDGINVPLHTGIVNDLLSGSSLGITVQKQDGSSMHINLNKKEYNASPILKWAIINSDGKRKVGYIALSRFTNIGHSKTLLDAVFNRFAGESITDLIVDLRYNTGGYIETAEYMANLIAPSELDGSIMYEEHFNELLQQGKAPILKTIPYLGDDGKPVYIHGRPATYADVDFSVTRNTYRFSKKGSLTGIRRIGFIVSSMTASASELLINCFKPYLDVTLVGHKTYGKPVGYFGIGIDRFTVYLTQFRMLNAAGEGDYYTGIPVDIPSGDDVTKDFGDPSEECLSKALIHIKNTTSRINDAKDMPGTEIGFGQIQIFGTKRPLFSMMREKRFKLR